MLIDAPRKTPKAKKKKAPSLPSYPTPAPKRAAPRPTPQQLRTAKAAERSYRSQGTAVKRAVTEKRTGLTHEQRTRKPQGVSGGRAPQERYYRSQGRGVERQGTRKTTGLTGAQIERLLKADRKQTKASGFSARERYGYTPAVTKHNVMPVPKELEKAKKLGYLERDSKKLKRAGFAAPGALEEFVSSPKYALKALGNAPKDVKELAVTTPSSIAHLAVEEGKVAGDLSMGKFKEAGERQYKLAKETVEPYKQAYKDPVKFFTERPVTSALMFVPAGKGVSLGAGRIARAEIKAGGRTIKAPSQTLARPTATLPGTSIRQLRVGSRSYRKRGKQEREDTGGRRTASTAAKQGVSGAYRRVAGKAPERRVSAGGTPVVSRGEIRRRVDEFTDVGQQHKQAAVASEARKINAELKQLPRKERKAVKRESRKMADRERKIVQRERDYDPEELAPVGIGPKTKAAALAENFDRRLSGAREGGTQHVERKFAHEFGSNWEIKRGSQGQRIVVKHKPKDTPEGSGQIYETLEDARAVEAKVKADKNASWVPEIMPIKGATAGETGGWAVVPKVAKDRFEHHGRVGTSPDTGAVIFRVGSRQFRKAVLPTSVPWLLGQATESVIRAAAAGAGPVSLHRFNKTKREFRQAAVQDALAAGKSKAEAEKIAKQATAAFEQRVISGGQFGVTGPAAEFAGKHRTLGEEFAPTGLAGPAAAVSRVAAAPVVRLAPAAYGKFSHVVFNKLNASVEQLAKKGLAGVALKQGPLMERRVIGLSEKAAKEAAQGLKGTSAQVQLAREVDRAYGKYSKFGPHARTTIQHTTPFIPWFVNMAQFVFRVLPADHPIKTSLLASYTEADREWREQNRLSYYGKDRVPDWMMGAYPAGKDKYIRAGRYMPFAPGEYVGTIGSQVLPQFSGAMLNLAGVDWKGEKIEPPSGDENLQEWLAANAGLSSLEAMVPLAGQLNRATGLGEHYVRGKKDKPSVVQGKSIPKGALDLINPVKPIGVGSGKRKPKKKKTSSVRGGSSVRGSVHGGSSIR